MDLITKGNVEDKERFISALGGGAMLLYALRVKGALGDVLSLLGRTGIKAGATSYPGPPATQVEASVTIGRPREEVYRFCRDLAHFPRFMRGLKARKGAASIACTLEIVEDVENERIGWRAVDALGRSRSGVLYLTPAPGGRGVEVCMIEDVTPQKGLFGRSATRRRGEQAELMLRGDLRRLKQLLEVGFITTTRGQPSGRNGG